MELDKITNARISRTAIYEAEKTAERISVGDFWQMNYKQYDDQSFPILEKFRTTRMVARYELGRPYVSTMLPRFDPNGKAIKWYAYAKFTPRGAFAYDDDVSHVRDLWLVSEDGKYVYSFASRNFTARTKDDRGFVTITMRGCTRMALWRDMVVDAMNKTGVSLLRVNTAWIESEPLGVTSAEAAVVAELEKAAEAATGVELELLRALISSERSWIENGGWVWNDISAEAAR